MVGEVDVTRKTVEEITRLLKGVPNTPVTLTLKEA
jgi:hypothetical protein